MLKTDLFWVINPNLVASNSVAPKLAALDRNFNSGDPETAVVDTGGGNGDADVTTDECSITSLSGSAATDGSCFGDLMLLAAVDSKQEEPGC